jgi:septal ring factor EnvC (AmiA/AmiB activator)
VGIFALASLGFGNFNTALGANAGANLTTGDSNNIDIGANVEGVAGESNTVRIGNPDITTTIIRGISGQTVASGTTVLVAANGQLGTVTSSKRFKEEIKPMDKASEALFSLKPVMFRYKKEIDPAGTQQFGLVAEDVEKLNPDLVLGGEQGQVNSVRYDQVNAMLLNEFIKEHKAFLQEQRKVQEQEAAIAQLRKEMETVVTRLEEKDNKYAYSTEQHTKLKRNQRTKIKGEK